MMFDGLSESGFAAAIGAGSLLPCDGVTKKKNNVIKVKFTEEEDLKLQQLVMRYGAKDWIRISQLMITRNPRQCRERWNNYINPALRTDPWSPEEDMLLDQKYAEYGPKWNKISKFLKNRSDNNIRNRWMMIARHRAKHQKSPISPPPTQRVEYTTPVVMPVVKEIRVAETRPLENPFESLTVQESSFASVDTDYNQFDLWNDFSFF
ncbi:Myb-like DNA-binding domain containing protein [Trichomonas vaginalis G3]|uniref:Myb-like DNA-binding domain containing protein n=3 Tax=Trichomonas vaginalis TaxID=5722 RepID=A0A8U0WP92_TRIV3|nr:transcription factor MYB24 (Myb1,Myb3r3) [Trichomonas vaginalis G3]AAX51243.1 MYB24 [Trichomonas vaginalis]EAY03723.1 Myb-like DNA-binding domain containing protein [Trichomonas vaginalis G3]KAI5529013.1 transcription factor MYB24 (Myb1,Myb3r3) [Trichomonas vaginalis G3]|eukprot:XP_001315946.1 Myb-like DNA-binding domain containing protein [Trichomonas vaginalis G3]